MDDLIKVYLGWKYPRSDTGLSLSPSPPTAESYDFTIQVIDIYSMHTSVLIQRGEDSISPAVALAESGYLGATPENPSLAISFKTLELYRRLRLRKPSFSVEAFAKVICDLYVVGSAILVILHYLIFY